MVSTTSYQVFIVVMSQMDVPFRNRLAIRPVNRLKHVVDVQGAVPSAGAGLTFDLIDSVDTPSHSGAAEQVTTNATVNGIFIHVEVVPTSATALPNLYFIIFKNPGTNLSPPQANLVGINDNRRYVIHQEMLMGSSTTNNNKTPRNMFQGVIKIPRGYKRFGVNDKLQIVFFSPGVTWEVCVQTIYKEFN